MADQKIVCGLCREEFIYTDGERKFLEDLVREKKLPEVVTPRRCTPCRTKIKRSRAPLTSATMPVLSPPPPPPVSVVPAPVPAPVPASAPVPAPAAALTIDIPAAFDDVRIILVASDFEQLVCREEVVVRQANRRISIRLADIGLPAMKQAMEKAVLQWWKS